MKYKKSIIVIMLAIFIFSIAAVSASDVNDTVIASEDTGQMELSAGDEITEDNIQTNENILTQASTDETVNASNEQDVLSSFGTYADLDYEIKNGGTTVELQHDYYTYDGTPVTIGITDDNRIIDGKGAVIDMAGAPSSIRIFDIDASSVTIKNLTIINVNFIDCGGAILFEPGSSGTVENCNFINNTASDGSAICFVGSTGTVRNCNFINNSCESYGGAIAFSYFGSTGTVTDCNFVDNSAKYGGAVAFAYDSTGTVTNCNFTNNNTADYGGAVYFSSSGNVTNCNFINGSSYYGGAVFWIGNDGRISDCNFTGNTAVRRGGAVHWGDTETESESQSDYTKAKNGIITRSNFINNTAAQGGAVFWFANDGNITDNCYFKDNNATGEGGAVYWKGKNGYISNKCTFTDNEAIIYGGAIYWQGDDGTLTDNCRFIKNSAYTQGADGIYRGGGAIFWMGRNANVSDNCSFINNTADTSEGSGFLDSYRGGGALYIPGAESHVTDCIFTGNFATHYGGAVYAVGGNSVVDRCSFENNSANMGGAAFTAASDYSYLSNCIFMNNYGIDFSSNGGAVNFKNYENSLSNCTFKDNYAENCGGAVYWQRDGGDVFNCSFENNSAYTSGGALYMEYGGTISYCDFVNNYVTGWASTAGAVYIYSASSIKNCNFTNNTAIKNGGAVFFQNKGELTDCNFKDNKASNDGGAVYFNSNGNVTNCNFTNNSATQNGGAVYFNKNVEGNVTDCSFINNSATKNGGAIYFDEGSNGRTINCNFINNTATNGNGGAINMVSGTVTNCNFTNNSARYGGAVYFLKNGDVTNCSFTENNATLGGAVYFAEDTIGEIINCNFIYNTASSCGGAVYFMSNGNVTNCSFTGNTATQDDGGAVYFDGNATGRIINCNFIGNNAKYFGGAIYLNSSGTVRNCNFSDNKATDEFSYGGAIYFNREGSVENCNFTNNTALTWAGAIFFASNGTLTNCNFIGNNVSYFGGAVIFLKNGEVTNCNFTNNTSTRNGGAVYFWSTGEVTNCNFTGNNATTGSAIYFSSTSATKNVSNSRFLNNMANAETLEVTKNENNITIIFTGNDNLLNAIYSNGDVSFTNVTYWSANGINNTGVSSIKPSRSNKEAGQNITVSVVVNDILVLSDVKVTDENGMVVLDISAGENYYISVRHDTDSYYTEAEKTISTMKFNVNVTSQTTNNKTVNITAKSNIPNEIIDGKLLFIVPNNDPINATYSGNGTWWAVYTFDDYAVYEVNASYIGLDNVTITNGTINIGKIPTSISVENETADLFVGDSINTGAALTPADAGNLTYTSSDESVAKVENGKIIAMGDGTAVITVSFTGREGYAPCENKTIKVTAVRVPTHLTVENITAHPGDKVNIKVNVTADDAIPFNGNINFILPDNSTVPVKIADGSGIVNWIIPEGYEGKYPTNATFEGDRRYLPSNAFGSITINKYDSKVTISPIASIDYGNNVTIKYSIENRTNINVTIDGVSYDKIINGDTITVIFPDAGNYNITIINNENYLYKSSNDTKSFTVNKVKSSLDVNGTSIYFGEDALLNYTTVNATGIEVTITDWRENPLTEGVDYNITVTGTQIILNFFDDGIHYVNVTTLTDANHIPTTEKVTVSVNPISDLEIILNPMNQTVNYGDVINWTAKIVNNGPNYALKSYFDVYASQGLVFTNPNVHAYSNHYRVDVPFQLSPGSYFTILINAMVNTTNADLTLNVSVSDEYTPDPNPANNNASATVKAEYTTADVNLTAPSEITAGDNLTVNVELPSDATGNVTASINGKNYTQEVKDGKATITVPDMDAGKNNINISYSGDDKYSPCEKSVEVTVKKATPKMTVKAKTFKDTTKTKKYTITLKDNKGNAIKNAKVYLKVNGVTYTATTNSKGQATFKIIKLTKKGTYIATITYNGNKNYNKITKKAKITVKETWKTISKGSKNTAMVKKIQKALKKNGFYIKEKGRYLKIDGIYQKYTVKAVKQFQKAKGLKVTGKVDYTTAKKLKLI